MHDYAKPYEGYYKDTKVPYVTASKPDGQSPIKGFALLAFSLGAGCSSQILTKDDNRGSFVSAATSYFAYAVNICFDGSNDGYYMFQYVIEGAFGTIALVEYSDPECTTINQQVTYLPVDVCISPNYGPARRELQTGPNIPFELASLEVYFIEGSTLPKLPVAVAKYTTYV